MVGPNNIYKKYMQYKDEDINIKIENGQVLSGTLDAEFENFLKHIIFFIGKQEFIDVLFNIQ